MQSGQSRGCRGEAAPFGVGQAQPLAKTVGVLRDGDRERSEAQHRVRPGAARRLDGDEARQAAGIGEAAEQRLEKSALAHRPDDLAGVRRDDELESFGAHALARQPRHAAAPADGRGEASAIDGAVAEPGGEAEEAQDAKIVLADALVRVADEADAARGEVVEPAERIMDLSVGAERERVDGEVAPARVGGKIAAERHLGVAPVGLDVLAQRRHLDRPAVDDDRHRAVGEAGRDDLESGRPGAAHHLVGGRGRRQIEIERRFAERQIAHRAADQPRLLAPAVQRCERPGQRPLGQRPEVFEPPVREARQGGHSIRLIRSGLAQERRSAHAPAHRPRGRGARSD